jgi:hypothetical protein
MVATPFRTRSVASEALDRPLLREWYRAQVWSVVGRRCYPSRSDAAHKVSPMI